MSFQANITPAMLQQNRDEILERLGLDEAYYQRHFQAHVKILREYLGDEVYREWYDQTFPDDTKTSWWQKYQAAAEAVWNIERHQHQGERIARECGVEVEENDKGM